MLKSMGPGARLLVGAALIAIGLARHAVALPVIGGVLVVISLASLAARR